MSQRTLTNRLRRRASVLRRRQGGFTLLELLVVVAILAAVAGTATIALQDTDARAAAAAHVAMMDELDKGTRTFRVLNKNAYPDRYDAMLGSSGTAISDMMGDVLAIERPTDLAIFTLTSTMAERLSDIGITELRYIDTGVTGCDTAANLEATIASRDNAVVAGNIFLSPGANGCGRSHTIGDLNGDATADDPVTVLTWTGGAERITGNPNDVDWDGAADAASDAGAKIFMAVGYGPSSTLFDKTALGGMTTVPGYRHVSETQYDRFVALFHVATVDGTGLAIDPVDQVLLVGVVDGAGDTKEEELGEWDGTRNTI